MAQVSLKGLRADASRQLDFRLLERGLIRRRADDYLWPIVEGYEGCDR